MIARIQVPLIHAAQRIQEIALFGGLDSGGATEVENGIAPGAKGRALVCRGQEALAIDGGSGANSAFEKHHETRQILILCAEPVENPGPEAGPADPGPAVVDEKLRLRVCESLVIA